MLMIKHPTFLAESQCNGTRPAERDQAKAEIAATAGILRGSSSRFVQTARRLPTFRGRVPSYYLKQIATETLLCSIEGVLKIDNELDVIYLRSSPRT